jgi:hypothetical protein
MTAEPYDVDQGEIDWELLNCLMEAQKLLSFLGQARGEAIQHFRQEARVGAEASEADRLTRWVYRCSGGVGFGMHLDGARQLRLVQGSPGVRCPGAIGVVQRRLNRTPPADRTTSTSADIVRCARTYTV